MYPEGGVIIETLKEKIDNLISNISQSEFEKMVSYIRYHYTDKNYDVNKEFLTDFFLTNYSTCIWHEALYNSLSTSNYNAIMDLEEEDWENADLIGSDIGRHVIDLLLKNI